MANETYSYPQLVDILPLDKIPDSLQGIENLVTKLTEKLFYKSFYSTVSQSGHSGFYSLTIITPEELALSIGGTEGITLILNPNLTGSGSAIPIGVNYKWDIIKHISDFKVANFSGSPEAYFDIILELLGLTKNLLIRELIYTLIEADDPVQKFIDDLTLAFPGSSISLNSGNHPNLFIDVSIQAFNEGINLIEHIYNQYMTGFSFDDFIEKIRLLFSRVIGDVDFNKILKEALIPRFSASINSINVGIRFPDKIFVPVDNNIPESLLLFDVGRIVYDTKEGFDFIGVESISFPESFILKTGFTIGFTNAKIDLSKTNNIPEATAEGRPNDFMGVYIQDGVIGFPAFWKKDSANSTGEIFARNLLVGTGGISGTLGLEAKTAGNPAPLIEAKFGSGFKVSLDRFSLEFQQNAIIGSDIRGTMVIPGFKDTSGDVAKIKIDIHIGQDGEFSVTAKEPDGIPLKIPNVLQFDLKSATIGRDADDRFYMSISGKLKFLNSVVSSLITDSIEFQEIIIWDDGQYEIKGGSLELPKAIGLNRPPLQIAVTAIHLGSDERDYENLGTRIQRKYKYFGFDGMVKVDPGGVEAKGKGIKLYISEDDGLDLHMFLRIESLKIDIIIPGDADPKDAAVLIAGFLSIKDAPAGMPGSEYAGGVSIDLPQAGIAGSAAMRFNPKVPYFIIDVEVEISNAIPLGSTGMGLYGFRGLLGKHFVATKNAANVPETDPWWKYYKAKVENSYKEGIQIGKFDPIGGFSLGFGVSLATSTDGGKVFSSKIFLLLSLRELIMLQGQAAILSERIKLNDPNDPPFFALIVITRESIEASLGVKYAIPDDKDTPGDIATVQGVLELGFFFNDSSAWYLNIGRDLPESYRIGVRLFDLFDCYFYFMLSARGIRTGAGARFEINKKWGPLEAYLYAYLDIMAKVAFKPKQFGGSIQLGGGIDVSIFGLGFSITAAASLAAEAPEPFNITGSVEACFKVLGKEKCAKFEFIWDFNSTIDTAEIGLIDRTDPGASGSAINIQTKEAYELNTATVSTSTSYTLPPNPSSWHHNFDDHLIPLDCFIDIEFKNGVNPYGGASTDKFGTIGGGAEHIKLAAPQKGKTPVAIHNFKAEEIFIYAWNADSSSWEEYDIYASMTEFSDPNAPSWPEDYTTLDLKQGYWQMEEKNKFNKLRILAQTPLSYMTQTSGEFTPENNGITSGVIFCDEEIIEHTCADFENYVTARKNELTDYTGNFMITGLPISGSTSTLNLYSGAYPTSGITTIQAAVMTLFGHLTLKTINDDAAVVTAPMTLNGKTIALGIKDNDTLEINFNEPMSCIDFNIQTLANQITVEYYKLEVDPAVTTGISVIETLVTSSVLTSANLTIEQQYNDPANPIDKVLIKNGRHVKGSLPVVCDPELTMEGQQLEQFLIALVNNGHLTDNFMLNSPAANETLYTGMFMDTPLYQFPGTDPNITYTPTINAETLTIVISDGKTYNCTYTLVGPVGFNWNNVSAISNLRIDATNLTVGPNYNFLIDVNLSGIKATFVINGHTTCHNIINCFADYSTFLFSLCTLSGVDSAYNETVPSSAENQAEVQSMMDAMQKTIQPIWRPNTTYAVAIKTKEAVSGGGTADHHNTFYYGFKTRGPIGHYHNYLDDGGTETLREDYQKYLDIDQAESFILSNLKHYIDYERSYPNANGDLLNAKPLFYETPKLSIYYMKQYMYAMFGNWDALSGLGAVEGGMNVLIQDAVEPPVAPIASPSWVMDVNSIKGKDTLALQNMIENAPSSDCPPDTFDQNGTNAEIEIDALKPLKLYTAVIKNSYRRDNTQTNPPVYDHEMVTREVHRYSFRTSQYANFTEQIKSYILAEGTGVVLKSAIFDVEKVIGASELNDASGMISNPNNTIGLTEYADKIERILQGQFKLGTLQPAIGNEFNFVKNSDTGGKLLGIWIRCPEPFNDPKLPKPVMESTLTLTVNSGGSFTSIFSKDGREVFVTNTDGSLDMPSGDYQFTFHYKEWDPVTQLYVNAETVIVDHTLNSAI